MKSKKKKEKKRRRRDREKLAATPALMEPSPQGSPRTPWRETAKDEAVPRCRVSVATYESGSPGAPSDGLDVLHVAFQRNDPWSLVGWAISKFDHGPFVHAELVFDGTFVDGKFRASKSFTAHARKGCEFRILPVYDAAQWELLPVRCRRRDADLVCQALKGDKYDFLGDLRFVIPVIRPTTGRWFCSDTVAKVLSLSGGPKFDSIKRIGPNDLRRLLLARDGNQIERNVP